MDNLPTHVGIIADGNRRWAKAHNLPTIEGHRRGMKAIEDLVEGIARAGIPFATFYIFSTENWNRSEEEVSYLMKLFATKILPLAEKMAKNNIKLLFLGSKKGLNDNLLDLINRAEATTASCTGSTISFCFNYGGEQEIAEAANAALKNDGEITVDTIKNNLYHPEVPLVDIIVRTSGEQRISGFMLWRAAYSEFLFLDKYFPEMTADDVPAIIKEYQNRNRRFGR